MKCKACKKDIPDESLYCLFCGERQVKERKKKAEVSVPKPCQRRSGKWASQIMINGERIYVSADSERDYYAKARAIKAGVMDIAKNPQKLTLRQAALKRIESRDKAISPSTIAGYHRILKHYFKDYMDTPVGEIDYQQMINSESARLSGKTISNAWGFLKGAVTDCGVVVPADLTLPQIIEKETPWIEPEDLQKFMNALQGMDGEIGALLAMHGLRRSEVYAITPSKIRKGFIHIEGARVVDANGDLVYKETNKNSKSRRKVKIRIPRLTELIQADTRAPDEFYCDFNISHLYDEINRACKKANLTKVGVHGLRRSFASLAYSVKWSEIMTMKEGGWSDRETMNKFYIKLAEADAAKQSNSMDEFFKNISTTTEPAQQS